MKISLIFLCLCLFITACDNNNEDETNSVNKDGSVAMTGTLVMDNNSLITNTTVAARSGLEGSDEQLFETFVPESQRRPTLGPTFDPQIVLSKTGDAARGRVISGYGSSGNEGINIAVPEGTPEGRRGRHGRLRGQRREGLRQAGPGTPLQRLRLGLRP